MTRLFLLLTALIMTTPATAVIQVEMLTNKGRMVIAVDDKEAPKTADNFLDYVRSGFFDGVIFHRVIPGFVIQGGGFMENMFRKTTEKPIRFENTGLKNLRYTLSMARTSDPHSATSQFFINLTDNPSLDGGRNVPGYAVFGQVIEGQQVVDTIAAVRTRTVGPYADVPVSPVVIEKATILKSSR